jgi:hypothetical protein
VVNAAPGALIDSAVRRSSARGEVYAHAAANITKREK